MDPKSFPLHEAARDGKILTVRGLVSQNPKSVLAIDEDQRVALHWAVAFQHLEIVSILLNPTKFQKSDTSLSEEHFEVNIDDFVDEAGWTPLHIAASVGNVEILKLLFTHNPKPDANLQTNAGLTCVHLATSKNHYDVVKELVVNYNASARIKDKRSQYPLHRAAAVGSQPLVQLLVKEGKSPINSKDINGWTPLHHALAEGFGDVAVLLVKLGADYTIEDLEGKPPLKVAVDSSVARYFVSELSSNGIQL